MIMMTMAFDTGWGGTRQSSFLSGRRRAGYCVSTLFSLPGSAGFAGCAECAAVRQHRRATPSVRRSPGALSRPRPPALRPIASASAAVATPRWRRRRDRWGRDRATDRRPRPVRRAEEREDGAKLHPGLRVEPMMKSGVGGAGNQIIWSSRLCYSASGKFVSMQTSNFNVKMSGCSDLNFPKIDLPQEGERTD